MAKVILKKFENPLTTKEKIINWLVEDDRDLPWLHRRTDIPYNTLYGIFIQNTMELNQERLNLINIACKTTFELDVPAETPTT